MTNVFAAVQVAELPEGSCGDLIVLRLYAALPLELQACVFVPPPEGCRRCVVATNIAETSITLDGVVYVVDGGMCKEKTFDPATGTPARLAPGVAISARFLASS